MNIVFTNETEEERDFIINETNPFRAKTILKAARETFSKPLDQYTFEECLQLLSSFHSTSVSTIAGYVVVIKSFLSSQGKDSSEWNKIVVGDIRRIIDKDDILIKYYSFGEIKNIVNEILNWRDKFIILGSYEGLAGDFREELWNVKITDFNEHNLTLKCPSGNIKSVSQELMEYAKRSAETYTLYGYNRQYYLDDPEPSGQYVVKFVKRKSFFPTPAAKQRQIKNRIMRLSEQIGEAGLTWSNLHYSGFLYQMQRIMLKYNCSFNEALNQPDAVLIKRQYDFEQSQDSTLSTMARNSFVISKVKARD